MVRPHGIPRMKTTPLIPAILAVTLATAPTLGCISEDTGAPYALRAPTCHAEPWQACAAMLAQAFPDDSEWQIEECGAAGVVATDVRGTTYAVTPDGSIWHVDDACGWTLLGSDPRYWAPDRTIPGHDI